jgi:hypothetical protein
MLKSNRSKEHPALADARQRGADDGRKTGAHLVKQATNAGSTRALQRVASASAPRQEASTGHSTADDDITVEELEPTTTTEERATVEPDDSKGAPSNVPIPPEDSEPCFGVMEKGRSSSRARVAPAKVAPDWPESPRASLWSRKLYGWAVVIGCPLLIAAIILIPVMLDVEVPWTWKGTGVTSNFSSPPPPPAPAPPLAP